MKTFVAILTIWLPCAFMAAEVLVGLGSISILEPENIEIEVGDAVQWQVLGGGIYKLEAFSSKFESGTLRKGEMLSHRFSEPGLFAYIVRQLREDGSERGSRWPGTVRVREATVPLPLFSLAAPFDGSYFSPGHGIWIIPNLRTTDTVEKVVFLSGEEVIGEAESPPYRFFLRGSNGSLFLPLGVYELSAELHMTDGKRLRTAPARATVTNQDMLSLPQFLNSGEIVFFYSHIPGQTCIRHAEEYGWNMNWKLPTPNTQVWGYHTFIDEEGLKYPSRFYQILPCP